MATLDELVLANGAKPGGQQGRSKRRGSIDVAARMKADIAAVAATQAAAAEGAGVEGAEVSLEEHFEMLQRASSHSAYFRGFEDEELRILAANMAIFHFDVGETIMQKGESASWVGVVLDGELEARGEGGVRLGAANVGSLAGEISLFQGGVRGAMMVSTQPGAAVRQSRRSEVKHSPLDRLVCLRARLAAPGSARHPGREAGSLGAQPLP